MAEITLQKRASKNSKIGSYKYGRLVFRFPAKAFADGVAPETLAIGVHDGVFAPIGFEGPIEIGGSVLMECPKGLADNANQDSIKTPNRSRQGLTDSTRWPCARSTWRKYPGFLQAF